MKYTRQNVDEKTLTGFFYNDGEHFEDLEYVDRYLDIIGKVVRDIREGYSSGKIDDHINRIDDNDLPEGLNKFIVDTTDRLLRRRTHIGIVLSDLNRYSSAILSELGLLDSPNVINGLLRDGDIRINERPFASPFAIVFVLTYRAYDALIQDDFVGGYKVFVTHDTYIPVIALRSEFNDKRDLLRHEEVHAIYNVLSEGKEGPSLEKIIGQVQDNSVACNDNGDKKIQEDVKEKIIGNIMHDRIKDELLARIIRFHMTDSNFYLDYVKYETKLLFERLSEDEIRLLSNLDIDFGSFLDIFSDYYGKMVWKWKAATTMLLDAGYSEEDVIWLFIPFRVEQWPQIAKEIVNLKTRNSTIE